MQIQSRADILEVWFMSYRVLQSSYGSVACNVGSCDWDCSRADWSSRTPCPMACNPGVVTGHAVIQEQRRSVIVPVRGNGHCPAAFHVNRYNKQSCNMQACVGDEICIAEQDLMIHLDGRGS